MPPTPRVLPIGPGLQINGNKITDHNRTPIVVSHMRIESRRRMANGMLRNFTIAQKRDIKAAWDMVPTQDIKTVDGFWGMGSLLNFYNTTFGDFNLTLTYGDKPPEVIRVMFKDFSFQLKKRGPYTDLYSFDVTFEEV